MDIAMGGSTNTILHLLAVANEAGVDFKMADIDRLSRVVPCICKTAPNNHDYYMEDVHRAGGIFAILKELDAGHFRRDRWLDAAVFYKRKSSVSSGGHG